MYNWPSIQAGIFAGESGGDYDALFGYSNRAGKQFAGTKLTDMTVDEALAFANPQGQYGQWVKGQVGRVATPMGAYQIVGTTLRDAKQQLGLTGNEKMTPELQDKLGKWVLETQGTGAWEGYKGPGNPRARRTTRKNMGLRIQPNGAPSQPEPEQRKGLLGGIFGDKFEDEDKYALAMALSGMSMRPNQGLQAALQMKMKNAQSAKVKNKTVSWLTQNGREDLAQAVESGAIDGRTAATLFYQKPGDDRTALMKNAEYIMAQNPEMTFNEALEYAKGGQTINVNGAPQVGTIPQGYQLAGGNGDPYRMEPIPGGPADTSKSDAAKETEQVRQADTALETINEIRALTKAGAKRAPFDLPETGIVGGRLADMGVNQEAVDVKNKIASLESAIAFDRLQRMREASPTGGALGAVSERELALLAADLGSLKQTSSPEEFNKVLNRIEDRYSEVMRKFSAYPGQGGGAASVDGYTIREID